MPSSHCIVCGCCQMHTVLHAAWRRALVATLAGMLLANVGVLPPSPPGVAFVQWAVAVDLGHSSATNPPQLAL